MLAGSCSKHVTFSQLLTNKCLNELAHFWGRGCGTVGRAVASYLYQRTWARIQLSSIFISNSYQLLTVENIKIMKKRPAMAHLKKYSFINIIECPCKMIFKWAIPGLFFFIVVFSIQSIVHTYFADDWIRTTDLYCRKRLLSQLHHNLFSILAKCYLV